MGFCYEGRKLCCDFCGTAGARKMKCPHGWCQDLATCPSCRKLKKHKTAYDSHKNCLERVEEQKANRAKLSAGGLTLELAVAGVHDYTRPGVCTKGETYYRIKEWDWGSAACDLFHKTWLDLPDIEHLRSLGHTIKLEEATP